MEPCSPQCINEIIPLVRKVIESSRSLWQIRQLPDVFVDAMVRNESNEIIFMSAYGRDGALQQLLAAFHLPRDQGGIGKVTLDPATKSCPARTAGAEGFVGDAGRLSKVTGKLPQGGLFGRLAHLFIVDEVALGLSHSDGSAWVLTFDPQSDARAQHEERIWNTIKQLLPLPTLDHWKTPLIEAMRDQVLHADGSNRWLQPAVGSVRASLVRLDEHISERISELVRNGVLTREPVSLCPNLDLFAADSSAS